MDNLVAEASDVCCFGPLGAYWEQLGAASAPIHARLPERFGYEDTNVHIAEFMGMLNALRWRRPGQWNMLVCDRSALFSAMLRSQQAHKWTCHPLESRLQVVLRQLQAAWDGTTPKPSWRLDMEAHPDRWNLRRDLDGSLVWMVRLGFERHGLVGVDIKSHQHGDLLPHPVVVKGNEQQDMGCRNAQRQPLPENIRLPSGGPFAFIAREGRMLTAPARDTVRKILRDQAARQWKQRRVQGKIAREGTDLFCAVLHPRLYTAVPIPTRWQTLALPQDGEVVDISGFQFRCLRAVGGGWTEQLHSDPELLRLAEEEARRQGRPVRTCPLCLAAAGTPRHVALNCAAMRPLVNHVRDLLEAELLLLRSSSELLREAARWSQARVVETPSGADRATWPHLCAWRCLITTPEREAFLSQNDLISSSTGVDQERSEELAYRGVLPLALGRFLCGSGVAAGADDVEEEHAVLRRMEAVMAEAEARSSRIKRHMPVVRFTSLLLLGLPLHTGAISTENQGLHGPCDQETSGAGSSPWTRSAPCSRRRQE